MALGACMLDCQEQGLAIRAHSFSLSSVPHQSPDPLPVPTMTYPTWIRGRVMIPVTSPVGSHGRLDFHRRQRTPRGWSSRCQKGSGNSEMGS